MLKKENWITFCLITLNYPWLILPLVPVRLADLFPLLVLSISLYYQIYDINLMPFRIPRHMSIRTCDADSTTVLNVIPVGTSEVLGNVTGTLHATSIPERGNAALYTSPFGMLEYNIYGLWVPTLIAQTFSRDPDATPAIPASMAEWDTLFRRLLFEWGSDGNEYYGANPDGSTTTYDTVKNVFVRRHGNTDTAPNNDPQATDTQDEPATAIASGEQGYGPQGIQRLFSAERWLSATAPTTITTSLTQFSAASLNDTVYADTLELDIMANTTGPGFFILGALRYETKPSEGFAASYGQSEDSGTAAVSMADKIRAMNAWMSGDINRVKYLINFDTTLVGDYLRSLLFGGDYSVKKITASDSIMTQLWTDKSPLRDNKMLIGTKLAAPTSTPYTIVPQI